MPQETEAEKLRTCIVLLNECIKDLVIHVQKQDERITLIMEGLKELLKE